MRILSRIRLRTKLALLMGLSALTLIAVIAVAASVVRQRMVEERIDKDRAIVDTTIGIAQALENRVAEHQLSREQAFAMLRDDIHAMRFDGGAGYVYAQTLDNMVVLHGVAPAMEGKPSPGTDANGRPLTDLIRDALRNADDGVVTYTFPKPGQTERQPKISYVARFRPWDLVFVSGAYIDDLDTAFRATMLRLGAISGAILLVMLLVAWLINRDIAGSLGRLQAAMMRLADGDTSTAIPGTDRGDEVGRMAGAVVVFKDNMEAASRLAAEHSEERQRAETARCAALVGMAESIETEAKAALEIVANRTGAMADAARNMSASAARTGACANDASAAATHALANAQTVASAAEQLAASIREIGGQVGQSTTVVARAVAASRATREMVEALNTQVGRIGTVADMISDIAAKTNLLALNATIEAARAGDAGKGFAVVASEVKQLATQTARSTEEIARHISEVRAATGASVAAVEQIEANIGEINVIAGAIAAAVEQQGAATAEIARNVTETAAAANEMTGRTNEVSIEAEQTGGQAADVLQNTSALSEAVHGLQSTVIHIVRTSTTEVDRRRYRRRPCLVEASMTYEGRTENITLHDISERGCLAITTLPCQIGRRVDIVSTRLGMRLQGSVAQQTADGLHIAFVDEGLPAAEVDRISLTTITDLVALTKNDHLAFVKRVADAVATGEKLPPDQLATQHNCRLGRWYDNVSDPATLALPAFKGIVEPHHAVHEAGRHALGALAANDMAAATRSVSQMQQFSQQVLRGLDEFGRAYVTTIQSATTIAA